MTEEITKLHFIRAREAHSKTPFVDPSADIKVIVQGFCVEIAPLFAMAFPEADPDKVVYLKNCFNVFRVRLEEDPAPMRTQIVEFEKAMQAFSNEERWFILSAFAHYVFYIAAMHIRRDGKADKETTPRLASVFTMLTAKMSDQWDELVKRFSESVQKELLGAPEDPPSVHALCVEDEKHNIIDIKQLAALTMGATGSQKWEDVADACDKYVTNNSDDDSDGVIACALAYPTYDKPYFEVAKDVGSAD